MKIFRKIKRKNDKINKNISKISINTNILVFEFYKFICGYFEKKNQ